MGGNVFISYRQFDPGHSTAVRTLAERLVARGFEVAHDGLYLDAHPGGPDGGWAKWSQDQACRASCVLIISSQAWGDAWHMANATGVGLGAAADNGNR